MVKVIDVSVEESSAQATDAMQDYLRRIGRTPLLTKEGEILLARRVHAGQQAEEDILRCRKGSVRESRLAATAADGREAQRELVEANLRLVVSVARKYQNVSGTMNLLDIVQEGNLGLMKAAEKFDYQRECRFSTYATWWIRQAITRSITDKSRTVRIPSHMVETMGRMARVQRELLDAGVEPTVERVAEELGVPVAKVKEMRSIGHEPISFDAPVGNEDGASTLGSFIVDPDSDSAYTQTALSELRENVRSMLGTLSEREASVIVLRFGLDGECLTLEQISKRYGVSRERIRQVEAKTMAKLRHPARAYGMHAYLQDE